MYFETQVGNLKTKHSNPNTSSTFCLCPNLPTPHHSDDTDYGVISLLSVMFVCILYFNTDQLRPKKYALSLLGFMF